MVDKSTYRCPTAGLSPEEDRYAFNEGIAHYSIHDSREYGEQHLWLHLNVVE